MSELHVIAPTAGYRACFDVTAEDVEGAHVDTRIRLPRAIAV